MKKLLILILFIHYCIFLLAQKNTLSIEIDTVMLVKKDLSVEISIKNLTNDTILTYLPILEDICASMLRIHLVETLLCEEKQYEIFPCEYVLDLRPIGLTNDNSVYIEPNSKITRHFFINKKHLINFNKKKKYSIYIELIFNSDVIEFISESKNVFTGKTMSNTKEIIMTK